MSLLPKAAVAASEDIPTDTDSQLEQQIESLHQVPEHQTSEYLAPEPSGLSPLPAPLPDLLMAGEPMFSPETIASSDVASSDFLQLRDRLLGASPQPLPIEIRNRRQATEPVLAVQASLTQSEVRPELETKSTVKLDVRQAHPNFSVNLAQAATPETEADEDRNRLPSLDAPDAEPVLPAESIPAAPPETPDSETETPSEILDSESLDSELGTPAEDIPEGSVREIDAVPDSLTADPNPLTFPTTTEEVSIEETQLITLEQAVDLAYRNNQSLQAALLSLEQATAAVREAKAALFPNLDITANATTSESSRVDAFGESSGVDTSVSGLTELNYDIFTGGARRAGIRAAELQEEISTLAVEVQQEEIRLTTANAYYDLQDAGEQIRINQSFLEEAARNLRDSRLRQEVGVGTRFDVLRAEVQFANARQSVIQSQSQERINRRAIAQLLNLPPTVSITATPVAVAENWPLDLEESIVLAFQNRAELEQQLYQADLNDEQRKIALAAIRPTVQLFVNYNAQTFINDNDGISDDYAFGARFRWTPFDGGAARASARQQEIASQIAEEQFSSDLDQVRFDVEQAFFNLQANQENIATSEIAVAQAEEALELANLRLQAGVGTQLDVLSAQSELTEAEANNVAAILGYNRALVAIERAISNVSAL
ncbi:TolC family protein [cf. Phormidesmis sp. LEGE 11477]|uniref:TolC family protein n=1 Tax=cf. Phormidesmis sp. LEGE 11477 TaxID=1828680 RepID=UPI0018823EFA|nr:TolC family protein [cf. Phormidesmis sp. LEGE 11477]MBE9062428.1 TolC family protein [cf. Phormidesmis sp. LEGE 11477]